MIRGGEVEFDFSRNPAAVLKWKAGDRIVLPDTTTYVGRQIPIDRISRSAFSAAAIRSITIASSIVTIEGSAFAQCTSLTTVTFAPNSRLRCFEMHAFFGARSLTAISIPNTTEVIGLGCFEGCDSLATFEFELGSHLKRIESRCCTYTVLKSILIPSSVQFIGSGCFSFCRALTSVTFDVGSHLCVLEKSLFEGTALAKFTVPRAIQAIKARCFAACRSLSDVAFGDGSLLEQIDAHAFTLTALVEIAFPGRLSAINESAFAACDALRRFTFPEGAVPVAFGASAFVSTKLSALVVPKNVESLGAGCFASCKSLDDVTFEEGSRLKSLGASAFECCRLRSIRVPRTVESIGPKCFADSLPLSSFSFQFPAIIRELVNAAFQGSGIQRIVVPQTVTAIGHCCFADCKSLTEVVFEPESQLRAIGSRAFQSTSMQHFTLPSPEVVYQADTFPSLCEVTVRRQAVPAQPTPARYAPLARPLSMREQKVIHPHAGKAQSLSRVLPAGESAASAPAPIARSADSIGFAQDRVLPECGIRPEECREVKLLGKGSFGRTVVLEREAREVVAKHLRFHRRRITRDQQTAFSQTVEALVGLVHPCIFPVAGTSQTGADSAVVIMPYSEYGSLAALLSADPKPTWWEPTAISIVLIGIVIGMVFAHSGGICHGSLKPSNVMLDGMHHARIADFGCQDWVRAGVAREVPNDATLYVDQGVYDDDDDQLGFAGDVYSFGIMLYEMVMVGRGSYEAMKRIALNRILSGTRPNISNDFSEFVRQLIDDCWSSNPKQRPTFASIFQICEKHQFQILAGTKADEVKTYVRQIATFVREEQMNEMDVHPSK